MRHLIDYETLNFQNYMTGAVKSWGIYYAASYPSMVFNLN